MDLGKLILQFFTALFTWATGSHSVPATYHPQQWWDTVVAIHNNESLDDAGKMQQVGALLRQFRQQKFPPDSVYALLYHRLGGYEADPQQAIRYMQQSLRINNAGHHFCSAAFTAKTYRNLALRYQDVLSDHTTALRYYDSVKAVSQRNFSLRATEFFQACAEQSDIYLKEGAFAEVLANANAATARLNTPQFAGNEDYLANTRIAAAGAAIYLKNYTLAEQNIRQAQQWWTYDRNPQNWFTCQSVAADIAIAQQQWQKAANFLADATQEASKSRDTSRMVDLLARAGYMYSSNGQYREALAAYRQQLSMMAYSGFTEENKVIVYNNLGATYEKLQQPFEALQWINKALALQMGADADTGVLQNPTLDQLTSRPRKSAAFTSLQNKAELLLRCYRQRGDARLLTASEQAFGLGQQLLTYMRQNQTEEESQLAWRERSRSFYQQALEMCYEKHNDTLAYQFLEQSRAALLNSRLNELGAAATLPPDWRKQETEVSLAVMNAQQQLLRYQPLDDGYSSARKAYDEAMATRQRFIQQLEQVHPAYHTYRYATTIPSVAVLQQYLRKNGQQWVQYFLKDSLLFVLYVDGQKLQLHRRVVHRMESQLADFLQQCTYKEKQQLKSFRRQMQQLSHCLYDTLLNGLPLQPGRLIICPDNTPIPFEALCTDTARNRYLLNDYAVSYAYSAQFLLKPYQPAEKHSGTFFFGMAPVRFPTAMQLPPLTRSEEALEQSAAMYPQANLATGAAATRQAFFTQLPQSTVANLFTHAQSTDTAEPRFFMADSSVRLSELQTIRHPATQLVVVSACQTAAGRLVNGEGVLSIARGFAVAGIPCTVATLWKADEAATYFITGRFNHYLSLDSAKDVALRRAKLDYMESREEDLPFYWADMTLTGNAEALNCSLYKPQNNWLTIGLVAGLLALVAAGYRLQSRNRKV